MKIVSFILSLILLGVTFVSCRDLAAASLPVQQAEVQLAQQDHDHNDTHSGTQDLCSPFCSCHCCHTHVVLKGDATIDWDVEEIPHKPSLHYSFYFPNPSFSIWQPPKIA